MSDLMSKMGMKPFRLFTDVSGHRFWTIVAETEVEKLDTFIDQLNKVMLNDEARKIMTGYHDLVEEGRREIYQIEG
ncbi:MAG TPA: hypothetical protein VJO14_07700 [Bacteroidota bacterium]|nr:hypothetical protein [Bacteroidota bacterium]